MARLLSFFFDDVQRVLERDLLVRPDIIEQRDGCCCAIYLEEFPEQELQIDHRIPFEVVGDDLDTDEKPNDFMLLSGSANRAKSWSCEHCVNWVGLKKTSVCRKCYWAYPEEYEHVAMRPVRRLDIMWSGKDVKVYDKLKRRTETLQRDMPSYVKDVIRKHIQD